MLFFNDENYPKWPIHHHFEGLTSAKGSFVNKPSKRTFAVELLRPKENKSRDAPINWVRVRF